MDHGPCIRGDSDDRTGWYIQRTTVAIRDGKPSEIIDRTPVAKFVGDFSTEIAATALSLSRAIEQHEAIFMHDGWKFDDLAKELERRRE
jgi:hypothetical protein